MTTRTSVVDSSRTSSSWGILREVMISAMGKRPVIAAPMAAPMMACSEMGVSRTRLGPKRSNRPTVVLNTPPAAATSSPRKITRSSRSISCAIPAATASRYVNSATTSLRPPRRRDR